MIDDITFCRGKDCPLKETCRRLLPDKYEYVSVSEFERTIKDVDGVVTCEYYWKK